MSFVNKGYGIQRFKYAVRRPAQRWHIDYGVRICLNAKKRIGLACFSFWVMVVGMIGEDGGGNGGIIEDDGGLW